MNDERFYKVTVVYKYNKRNVFNVYCENAVHAIMHIMIAHKLKPHKFYENVKSVTVL